MTLTSEVLLFYFEINLYQPLGNHSSMKKSKVMQSCWSQSGLRVKHFEHISSLISLAVIGIYAGKDTISHKYQQSILKTYSYSFDWHLRPGLCLVAQRAEEHLAFLKTGSRHSALEKPSAVL